MTGDGWLLAYEGPSTYEGLEAYVVLERRHRARGPAIGAGVLFRTADIDAGLVVFPADGS